MHLLVWRMVYFIQTTCLYCRNTKIEYETPEVECEDGTKVSPLKLTFPDGQGEICEDCKQLLLEYRTLYICYRFTKALTQKLNLLTII